MNNGSHFVYYRLPLSQLLLQRIQEYCVSQRKCFSKRTITEMLNNKMPAADTAAVYLSSYAEYERYIVALFSKKTAAITLHFRYDRWEKMVRMQRLFGISMGAFLRLILSTYCYSQGNTALPVRQIAQVVCVKGPFEYAVALTEPVCDLLKSVRQTRLGVSNGTIFRASYLFYAGALGNKTPLINRDLYRVNNTKLRWKRLSFLCGNYIKSQIDQEKNISHATIPVVISHTLYSFLQEAL